MDKKWEIRSAGEALVNSTCRGRRRDVEGISGRQQGSHPVVVTGVSFGGGSDVSVGGSRIEAQFSQSTLQALDLVSAHACPSRVLKIG